MAQTEGVKQELQNRPPQKAAPTTIKSLINLPAMKQKFTDMLGEKKAAGFLSSIINVVDSSTALKSCDPMNVISQAAVAASLDLPIVGSLGFAAIVPYDGKAQFQIMAKGFIQLAIRTGQYKRMNVSEVYADEMEYWNPITGEFRFSDPKTWKLRYEGKMDKIVGYVAFFQMLNGFEKYLYMTKAQCLAHGKKFSQSYQRGKGKWVTDEHAMCLKTPIKLLISKWGMMSIDMQRAMIVDQASVVETPDGEMAQYIDLPDAAPQPDAVETPAAAATPPAPKMDMQPASQTPPLTMAGNDDGIPRDANGDPIGF